MDRKMCGKNGDLERSKIATFLPHPGLVGSDRQKETQLPPSRPWTPPISQFHLPREGTIGRGVAIDSGKPQCCNQTDMVFWGISVQTRCCSRAVRRCLLLPQDQSLRVSRFVGKTLMKTPSGESPSEVVPSEPVTQNALSKNSPSITDAQRSS